jgi:hypothetical protein
MFALVLAISTGYAVYWLIKHREVEAKPVDTRPAPERPPDPPPAEPMTAVEPTPPVEPAPEPATAVEPPAATGAVPIAEAIRQERQRIARCVTRAGGAAVDTLHVRIQIDTDGKVRSVTQSDLDADDEVAKCIVGILKKLVVAPAAQPLTVEFPIMLN